MTDHHPALARLAAAQAERRAEAQAGTYVRKPDDADDADNGNSPFGLFHDTEPPRRPKPWRIIAAVALIDATGNRRQAFAEMSDHRQKWMAEALFLAIQTNTNNLHAAARTL